MTTPNEQPVSDTPRSDAARELAIHCETQGEALNLVLNSHKRLEHELEVAIKEREAFQKAIAENISCEACAAVIFTGGTWPETPPHTCGEQYRAELEAVARAAVLLENHTIARKDCKCAKCSIVNAIESLRAKGWTP